jgi:hypothetical protein
MFLGLPVLRTTTVDKVRAEITIHEGMADYSGWDVWEHLKWISELSGLDYHALAMVAGRGYQVLTDEAVSYVWLVSRDYYKSKARLLYEG